jgi:glycosyltransferase involved in cell wall biosynthesis
MNTDWHYGARILPRLSEECPNVHVSVQQNVLADAEINFRYALSIARSRGLKILPQSWNYSLSQDTPVFASDIRAARPDVLLSYERYPNISYNLPVAWITSPSYREVCYQLGYTEQQFEDEVAWKCERAKRASRLIFTTQVSLENFLKQSDSSLREKSRVIPFLIRGLTPLADIRTKWQRKELNFLFVGREARRKGLPAALEAIVPLLKENPAISFTIVSRMDDGPIEVPTLPNLRLQRETGRSEVLKLMSEANVLIMPSAFESYGFVYIEAMSQGCLPLALDRPVQRELIGEGGILMATQESEEIRALLKQVIAEPDVYFSGARRAQQEFRERHAPEKVASQFHDVMLAMQRQEGYVSLANATARSL